MTSVLGKSFNGNGGAQPSKGESAFKSAMEAADDLLHRLRNGAEDTAAARSVLGDIWAQAHNRPFMTTVYQAVQEAKSGPEILREARLHHLLVDKRGRRV